MGECPTHAADSQISMPNPAFTLNSTLIPTYHLLFTHILNNHFKTYMLKHNSCFPINGFLSQPSASQHKGTAPICLKFNTLEATFDGSSSFNPLLPFATPKEFSNLSTSSHHGEHCCGPTSNIPHRDCCESILKHLPTCVLCFALQ